jgi:hypothetical protein
MSEWHIAEDLMAIFAAEPGEIDDATAASIEQHLTGCRSCQVRLAGLPSRTDLDAIWANVEDRVDRVGTGFEERMLRRFALESGAARLMAATPALRVGALLAVGLMVAAVVLASRATGASDVFLVLAPVVPVALVALSFAPGADPAGECGLATPVFGFGLVMRRALAIELVAVLVLLVGSLFVPIDGLRSLGWLIPGLALSLGSLAGGVRWTVPETAASLTTGWIAVLVLAHIAQGSGGLTESAVFDPAGQLVLGSTAAGACLVVAMNRQVLFQEVKQ